MEGPKQQPSRRGVASQRGLSRPFRPVVADAGSSLISRPFVLHLLRRCPPRWRIPHTFLRGRPFLQPPRSWIFYLSRQKFAQNSSPHSAVVGQIEPGFGFPKENPFIGKCTGSEQRRRRTLFKPTRRADGDWADFLRCSLLIPDLSMYKLRV
jgi:hypothetical protein